MSNRFAVFDQCHARNSEKHRRQQKIVSLEDIALEVNVAVSPLMEVSIRFSVVSVCFYLHHWRLVLE